MTSSHCSSNIMVRAHRNLAATVRSTLCICTLFTISFFAQAQRPDFKWNEIQRRNIFFWSSEAPMTRELNKFTDIVRGTEGILKHFAQVEDLIVRAIRSNATDGVHFVPCTATQGTLAELGDQAFALRGWPKPATKCISDVSVNDLQQDGVDVDVNQVFSSFEMKARGVRENIRQIAEATVQNFTDPAFTPGDVKSFMRYDFRRYQCHMHLVTGFRLGENAPYYAAFNIQNANHFSFLPYGTRKGVVEYATVRNGILGHNLRMWLPVRGDNDDDGASRTVRSDCTTMMRTMFLGPLKHSSYSDVKIEENPSMRRAIEEASLSEQTVVSTLTYSGIAILTFPLLLNIVPLSLISKTTYIEMLLSILFSDTLTVLPLAIKGVELVLISRARYRGVAVRMSGDIEFPGKRPENIIMESWASECRISEGIGRTGAWFLITAMLAWIIGVTAEVVAYRYNLRRRERGVMKRTEKEFWELSYSDDEYSLIEVRQK